MIVKDNKIYVDEELIAIINRDRKKIQLYDKNYLDDIVDLIVSDESMKDYSWEIYHS